MKFTVERAAGLTRRRQGGDRFRSEASVVRAPNSMTTQGIEEVPGGDFYVILGVVAFLKRGGRARELAAKPVVRQL
ncbi:MAG: hypothetical protein VW891_17670, partial [Novosphingobium sp.]